MLLAAERPVILVGQGVKYGGAADDLLRARREAANPGRRIRMSGIGAIDTQHPLSLGLVSRGGAYQANQRGAAGRRAAGARRALRRPHLELVDSGLLVHHPADQADPRRHRSRRRSARNYPVALGLMADVRTFLRQVLAELDRAQGRRRRRGARARNGSRRSTATARNGTSSSRRASPTTRTPIHPQRAAAEIDKALPDDAIMVSDIGVHHNWLLQFCKPKRPDSLHRLHGLRPDGLRRRRRARREVRRARPAVRVGVRRRRVLHARQRARHRGRVQSAGRLGGVEQLRLCVDPRVAARLSRRPRACHRLQASRDRQALQSGLRRDGALGRRRGRAASTAPATSATRCAWRSPPTSRT